MTPPARKPVRIQQRRARGWRMPEGAIYVGRPSRDGNPYKVASSGIELAYGYGFTAAEAVRLHRADLERLLAADPQAAELWRRRLRGHDLVCWCALDAPCHADTILELANT